jgi:hypothetical protein
MNQAQKDYCFCTLALGQKYRVLTKQLAEDLEAKSPGTFLVVYTDEPNDFNKNNNILAFKHQQQGILHCYNDKRLVISESLSRFKTAICIDADTRILNVIPDHIEWTPGITVGHRENLIAHVSKYTPERLAAISNVGSKLNLNLEEVEYVGESLFIITRDQGREMEFLQIWGVIGRYLELKGIHSGEGNSMGLAAAKVGWKINTDGWETIKQSTKHLDASHMSNQMNRWDKFQKRLAYHYRLNQAKLMALQNFNFYYR